jgi:hypothetical protein
LPDRKTKECVKGGTVLLHGEVTKQKVEEACKLFREGNRTEQQIEKLCTSALGEDWRARLGMSPATTQAPQSHSNQEQRSIFDIFNFWRTP